METKNNTSTKSNEKMTRVQKVIVILTAVVLAIILILVAATRYMGSSNTYPITFTPGTTSSTDPTDDTQNTTVPSDDTDNKDD